MREPLVSKVLKFILYVMFATGILGTITLPWMIDTYMHILYDAYYLQSGYRLFIVSFLMLCAIIVLWVIWEMICMLRSVPKGPFIMHNVNALKRIGIFLMVLAALFFVKCLYYVTFLTMACGFLFIVCGLFAFTLCNLFRQAVVFKEENDLTI